MYPPWLTDPFCPREEEDRLFKKLGVSRWDALTPQHASLIRTKKNDISRVTAWLLEHDLIVQHRTYLALYIPPSAPPAAKTAPESIDNMWMVEAFAMGFNARLDKACGSGKGSGVGVSGLLLRDGVNCLRPVQMIIEHVSLPMCPSGVSRLCELC